MGACDELALTETVRVGGATIGGAVGGGAVVVCECVAAE